MGLRHVYETFSCITCSIRLNMISGCFRRTRNASKCCSRVSYCSTGQVTVHPDKCCPGGTVHPGKLLFTWASVAQVVLFTRVSYCSPGQVLSRWYCSPG